MRTDNIHGPSEYRSKRLRAREQIEVVIWAAQSEQISNECFALKQRRSNTQTEQTKETN